MSKSASLDRQPNESEHAWQRRLRKYIRANAPSESRYYVRNGTPGRKSERWFIPAIFGVLGVFFIISMLGLGANVRELNGPNGRLGEFVVESLQQQHTKNADDPEFTPIVTIRGEQIVPLFSQPNKNTYQVGDVVKLRYSQQGDVVAAFTNADGQVSNPAVYVGFSIGLIFVLIGILMGVFYRGAVDERYIDSELARLTGKATTTLSTK